MILWRQTQNKEMLRYLNKQNFNVSFIDVGKKQEMGKWRFNEWYNPLIEGSLYT